MEGRRVVLCAYNWIYVVALREVPRKIRVLVVIDNFRDETKHAGSPV
jgi:hypothetical protein